MKTFFVLFALLLTMSSFAQQPNPWASIGKAETKKYLTLSDGKYDEFHANDRYVKVGSAIVDMKTNKIDHFVEEQPDTTEYANEADVIHRWLSPDPKEFKYASLSPYSAFGNSPMLLIDPGGETLRVSAAQPELIEQYKTTVSLAFAGKVEAKIENGMVSFHQLPDTKLTENEAAALNELNKVVNSSFTANIKIVKNDKNVRTDDWATGKMDIGDIDKFGTDDNKETSKGLLVHIAVEQLEKGILEELRGAKFTEADASSEQGLYIVSPIVRTIVS